MARLVQSKGFVSLCGALAFNGPRVQLFLYLGRFRYPKTSKTSKASTGSGMQLGCAPVSADEILLVTPVPSHQSLSGTSCQIDFFLTC
jgi:hypothetical protein